MSWTIDERDLVSDEPDFLSTIFTVGNGQACTRGTLGEDGLDAFRGMYISGLYTRAGYGLNYFLTGPDWLAIDLADASGSALEMSDSHRSLDMRRGLLHRTATFTGPGVKLEVREERMACLHEPALHAQRLTVRVIESGSDIRVGMGIDGDVRNHRAKYFKPGQLPNCDEHGLKLSRVETARAEGDAAWVVLHSPQVRKRVAMACRVRQISGESTQTSTQATDTRADIVMTIPSGDAGRELVFEKLCRFSADIDDASMAKNPEQLVEALDGETFEQALAGHESAWEAFWQAADVEIEGDPRAQQAVRYALWSTRIAAPDDGGRSSIGAKNLTGDWYRGAVFWDMEMFQLPLLAAVAPELARNHIRYRARRLDAARTLARQDGYDGARFPWHSYMTGLEEPPCIGGFLYQQVHLNAAVGWGMLHYWDLTHDTETMVADALPVLVELCRYWCSRTDRGEDGMYHIRHVCGPDEVHKDVDDNTYTNRMVKELLRRTNLLIDRLGTDAADEVEQVLSDLGADEAERSGWQEVSDHLAFPTVDGEGVLAQFAGFGDLPEPDKALRASGEGMDKTNKQADTLLLFQTVGNSFWDGDLERHYSYYAPLCNQTSSLSMCTHALLAARLGRRLDARKLFEAAAGVDLEDSYGNTKHGIHGAGEGGIWLAVVQGFGGLTVQAGVENEPARLAICPSLPPWWEKLTYRLRYAGQPIRVTVEPDRLTLENGGDGESPALRIGKQMVSLKAGECRSFEAESRWQEPKLEGVIFDLDGVLVKTDHFHYQAWKQLADELGLAFDETVNHRLRGVSRQESLRIIYEHNGVPTPDEATFLDQCTRKNDRYVELIDGMTSGDVLDGSLELLRELKEAGIGIALASASRNAGRVLERTGLGEWFDAVIDGSKVTRSKPDPQGFLLASQQLRAMPWNCLGVEDAAAGIEAIHRAGMAAVGIGDQTAEAEAAFDGVAELSLEGLRKIFADHPGETNPYMEMNVAKVRSEEA